MIRTPFILLTAGALALAGCIGNSGAPAATGLTVGSASSALAGGTGDACPCRYNQDVRVAVADQPRDDDDWDRVRLLDDPPSRGLGVDTDADRTAPANRTARSAACSHNRGG